MAGIVQSKRIVIAQYKEDVGWTKDLPGDWFPYIVQKGRELPNRGREPTSFLYAILHGYQSLKPQDIWCFVQGDPMPHCGGSFWDGLQQPVTGYRPITPDQPVVVFYKTTGEQKIYKDEFITDAEGNPHHPGVPVGKWYEAWLQKPFPKDGIRFNPGGQFITTGASILRRPEGFYRQVYDDTMAENNGTPYVLERLWRSIFA